MSSPITKRERVMIKKKLLEIVKNYFPEYEIVNIHYPKTPLEAPEYIAINSNLPKGLYTTVEEYLKFYYELEKQTPFYPVFPISFQFANENDIISEECQYIPVWTRNKKFLKEFYKKVGE